MNTSPFFSCQPPFPVRVNLGHRGAPPALLTGGAPVYFITACARFRSGSPFLSVADAIWDAGVRRHCMGLWFLHLCVVMPDHVHLLAGMPPEKGLARSVGDWKRLLALRNGVCWQRNFFDHRIRSPGELSEKWDYVRLNPVRKGLCAMPDDWPWWTGFHSATGHPFPRAWTPDVPAATKASR